LSLVDGFDFTPVAGDLVRIYLSPTAVKLWPTYNAAKTAASSTELSAVQTHGDSTWATATEFSTHNAADVATAILATPANKLVTDASGAVTPTSAYDAAKTAASATALAAAVTKIDTIDGIVDAIVEDTGTSGVKLADDSIKAATFDETTAYPLPKIDGKTPQQALQIIAAAAAGKVSGARTGTEVFKGLDGATPRISATTDASGNRTAVTYL
jgi:hypothetical protein